MEGISGIVHIDQVSTDGQDYSRGRELMTSEVNAAALGAFDAGADEVVINDSHADMRNIIIEKLDPRIHLISGDLKPLSMVQGVEDGFDAAFLVGYHAGKGAKKGILDHTYYGAVVTEVQINGKPLNELGINALVAGHYNTPVVLVTGDEKVCQEAKDILGEVEAVTVKWAVSRYAARSIHPDEAQRKIREAAKSVLGDLSRFKPYKLEPPFTLQIRMLNSGMADSAESMPGAVRIDPHTIEYGSDEILTIFKGLITLLTLAAISIPKVRRK
jgi:D-amino peptidase